MRYLAWVLKFLLFALIVTFAVKNAEPVTVRYYFGGEWRAPLVFVMLIVFCAGVAAGLSAALAQVFRQRGEIATLKRELRQAERKGAEETAQPVGG